MNKMHRDTIGTLAERDDLSRAELLALAAARKAEAPVDEVIAAANGWRVTISHHVHTGGHWSAGASRPQASGWISERCLYVGPSESECRAAAQQFVTDPH